MSSHKLLAKFRTLDSKDRISFVGMLILGFPPMSEKRIFWLNQLGHNLLLDESRLVTLFQESIDYIDDLEKQTP